MCRSACQAWLNHYSAEISIPMTAKKKVSNPKSAKPTKAKASAAKAPAKKPASKPAAKKAAPKKVAQSVAKKKPAPSSSTKKPKAGVVKSPSEKAEVKPTAKKPVAARETKKAVPPKGAKATPSKAMPKKRGAPKGEERESAAKKIARSASKLNRQVSEEKSSDGLGFSLDDVRRILQSKKKGGKKTKPAEEQVKEQKTTEKKSPSKEIVSKVKKITTASIDDILGFGSVSVSKRPVRDENKVPKEWVTYYKALKSMRDSLKGSLGERSSETIGASARESGELSLNSSDAGTETFDRDLALSMVANDQEALEEIEDAIDRIFDGSYGICQQTQKPIKKNRLQAVPFTRFSLEGQMLYEKSSKRDRDSGSGAFATISDSTMGEED